MATTDILIIGVLYNTYQAALRYLESLSAAETGNIGVIIVDNSTCSRPPGFVEKIKSYHFLEYIETGKNLGYFGGACAGLNHYLKDHAITPGWILVTNVDIVFSADFFHRLNGLGDLKNIGIVAPSIISKKWNTDYNPQRMERYPKSKILFYRYLYACFLLHNLYLVAAYLKKWISGLLRRFNRDEDTAGKSRRKIYAPHGSCLVFSHNYFSSGGTLDPPGFLFGEEIMIAEAAIKAGLDIVYHPELIIYDFEHASTGFFVTPKTNRYYRDSIRAILDRYYK